MFVLGYIQEVIFSVVKRIPVQVVWYHIIGGVGDYSVHTQKTCTAVNVDLCASVIQATGLFRIPMESIQGLEPFGITESNHASLEWYSCARGEWKSLFGLYEHYFFFFRFLRVTALLFDSPATWCFAVTYFLYAR